MYEQILIYSLCFLFFYSIIKGFKQGGISELISIFFFTISFLLAVKIFDTSFYKTITSITFFIISYNIGNFIAYLFISKSTFDQITGTFMGIIKFFVFLTTLTTVLMFMDSVPPAYTNIVFVKIILTPAKYLKQKIEEKKQ